MTVLSVRRLPLLLLVAAFSGLAPAAEYTFADFSSPTGLNLVGDTAFVDDRLRLTPALEDQVGSVWLDNRVDVQGGFTASFQFQITELGGFVPDWEPGVSNTGADGFAFVIQNASPTALGLYASGIGYFGITNSVAIEFDMWHNKPSYCEPNGNHIAVQTLGADGNHPEHCEDPDGAFANPTLGIATPAYNMSDGAIYNVLIHYMPGMLHVYFEDMVTPTLSVAINLADYIDLEDGRSAYFGFTSSTGGAWQNHDLLSLSVGEIPEPGTISLVALGLALAGWRRARR